MRKILLVLSCLMLFVTNSFGQTAYNPFTQNIHFEPEPSPFGFPCGSVQTVAFTQGMTTQADADLWQTEPLQVKVCITGFTFNGPAANVVTGSYASNFNWAFDTTNPNCIIGTQNQILVGTGTNPVFPNPLSSGSIKLSLLVPAVSPISTILSVDVTLIVPAYMQAFNSIPDDDEATQTQTFCELMISGTVFHDYDTVLNLNDVNGTPIDTPGGVQLYANLIGTNGSVVATTSILPNGTYQFLNVTPNTIYTVQISIHPGIVGQPAPVIELPPLWDHTGEDCCDNTGNDGNADGINTVAVTNVSVSNVNFGIIGLPPTGSLPTILQGFFVTEYNCKALLSWTTSQEINSSHVEIFKKEATQSSYKKIASVISAGNSSVEKMYSYLDKDVNENSLYEYQLKFVDIDGQFTTSNIKTINLKCSDNNTSINVFPNPATNKLNVLYVTEEDNVELSIEIVDIAGRTILSKSQVMQNGGSMITLDINSLAIGTYILHYHDVEGLTVGSVKFLRH